MARAVQLIVAQDNSREVPDEDSMQRNHPLHRQRSNSVGRIRTREGAEHGEGCRVSRDRAETCK